MDNESAVATEQTQKIAQSPSEFEGIKSRLDELVSLVNDDTLSLDTALDYYEEAVRLGMQASALLEEGIVAEETAYEDNLSYAENLSDAEPATEHHESLVEQSVRSASTVISDADKDEQDRNTHSSDHVSE